MNNKLLLLDWDDVVMDRSKVRELQVLRSVEKLGKEEADKLWDLYAKVRKEGDGKIEVDEFVLGFEEGRQEIIHDIFYGIDFAQCVDREGWNSLINVAKNIGFDIRIFSEGSREYQLHKINSSGLNIDSNLIGINRKEIYQNKVDILVHELWEELSDRNYHKIVYVDDRGNYLDGVKRVFGDNVTCVWMDNRIESQVRPVLAAETVSNLGELSGWLQENPHKIEGQVGVGLER